MLNSLPETGVLKGMPVSFRSMNELRDLTLLVGSVFRDADKAWAWMNRENDACPWYGRKPVDLSHEGSNAIEEMIWQIEFSCS